MRLYYIERSNLIKILRALSQRNAVFVHARSGKDLQPLDFHYSDIEEVKDEDILIGDYRAEQPIKSFLTFSKEKVSDYFVKELSRFKRNRIIVGAKACDLASLAIQDYVFRDNEPIDQDYIENRNRTLIIGADCTAYKSVCYCMYYDIMPYPTKSFDINLSPVRGGFVVEIGTEKGEHLVNNYGDLFRIATAEEVTARDNSRNDLCNKLKLSVADMNLPAKDSLQSLVKKGVDNPTWKKWSDKCVECGACTHACPTCHCFLLYDQKKNNGFERLRTWDSCQYYGFAVVAGGASPRPNLASRLRNRYVKKFDYFPDVSEIIACTGCGRCIEACIGKIDMRDVFKDLAK